MDYDKVIRTPSSLDKARRGHIPTDKIEDYWAKGQRGERQGNADQADQQGPTELDLEALGRLAVALDKLALLQTTEPEGTEQ